MSAPPSVQPSSIWCTEIDLGHGSADPVAAPADRVFDEARVLVRIHGETLQFVQVPLSAGGIAVGDLVDGLDATARDRLAAHLAFDRAGLSEPATGPAMVKTTAECHRPAPTQRTVTVVVCTRGRGESLRACLRTLRAMTTQGLEFVIVDNAPTDESTANAFRAEVGSDPRFMYVVEPRPGLSCARNRGLAEAKGEVIAYTDDDVRVDNGWIDGILVGFDRGPQVACVTSLVCTAELETAAEHYFDSRVSWATRCEPKVYGSTPPIGDSLYPYAPGLFGTGAGMAFRTAVIRELGGFDEALGAGTRTAGGEDLDAFVRILLSGHSIAYEPSSLVWHHHRAELKDLRRQMYFYGTGLSAFIVKHLTDSGTRRNLVSRIPSGLAKLASIPKGGSRGEVRPGSTLSRSLLLREFAGMAMGPALYGVARRNIPAHSADATTKLPEIGERAMTFELKA